MILPLPLQFKTWQEWGSILIRLLADVQTSSSSSSVGSASGTTQQVAHIYGGLGYFPIVESHTNPVPIVDALGNAVFIPVDIVN